MIDIKLSNKTWKYPLALIAILLLVTIQPGSAGVFLLNGSELSSDQILTLSGTITDHQPENPGKLDFFYDFDCQSCQGAMEYIRAFEKKNPDVPIIYYNLGFPAENQALFEKYKSRFNTTSIRYPAVFIGDIAISGSSDIIHYTKPLSKGA